jgi:hypothetical protein
VDYIVCCFDVKVCVVLKLENCFVVLGVFLGLRLVGA